MEAFGAFYGLSATEFERIREGWVEVQGLPEGTLGIFTTLRPD